MSDTSRGIRRLSLLLLAVAVVVAGCNDDGRDLADAPPPTEPTAADPIVEDTEPAGAFELTSPAFADGGAIESQFTCDGDGLFPPLVIAGAPTAAAELAVVVVDESADGYVHWALSGLPASTATLDPTIGLPESAVAGTTTGGVAGWEGPCPPADDEAHVYRFTVYAFAEPVGMEPGLAGADAVAVLGQTSIGSAALTGTYARQP